jgi:AsmA family protein
MRILKVLLSLVALVAVSVAALLLYLQHGDLNRHRPLIADMATSALDREVKLEGELALTLWPLLTVTATDISVANAAWSESSQMFELGALSATIDTRTLLSSGPITINDVQVSDLKLLLETSASGEANWEFGDAAASEDGDFDGAGGGLPVIVRLAELRSLQVTLRDTDKPDRLLDLDTLLLARDGDRLALTSQGMIVDLPLQLQGNFGPIDQLYNLGAIDLDLQGTLGRLALSVSGTIEQLDALDGVALQSSINTADIGVILHAVGIDLPLSGPTELQATVQRRAEITHLITQTNTSGLTVNADLTLAQQQVTIDGQIGPLNTLATLFELPQMPPQALSLRTTITPGPDSIELHEFAATAGTVNIEASGTVGMEARGTDLQLAANGDSLAALRSDLPTVPFELTTRLRTVPGQLQLDTVTAQIGDSDLRGEASITTGEQFAISTTFQSTFIDLGQLMPEPAPETATASKNAPAPRYVFTEDPLPLTGLTNLRAQIKADVGTLVQGDLYLKDLSVKAQAIDGKVNLDVSAFGKNGGKLVAANELLTDGSKATLASAVKVRGAHLNITSGGDLDAKLIPIVDLTLDLKTSGASQRQMAAAANGKLLITQGPGKVKNSALSKVSGDIFAQLANALNPMSKTEEYSNWECSLILVEMDSGQAVLQQMMLQGEKVMIVGGGDVDLDSEALRLEFNTKPRKGIGISADMFVTPFVALKGTLAQPHIGLNEKGTLVTAGAAAATGGLSLLVKAVADRASAEVDHCQKTLPNYKHPPL